MNKNDTNGVVASCHVRRAVLFSDWMSRSRARKHGTDVSGVSLIRWHNVNDVYANLIA